MGAATESGLVGPVVLAQAVVAVEAAAIEPAEVLEVLKVGRVV